MTARQLIELADDWPIVLVGLFVAIPLTALAAGLGVEKPERLGRVRYLYSVLVYASCVPGILAAVLTGYALFLTHENLRDVNILVYLLPLVSMGLTLYLIGRVVDFDKVPGFDRLSGLMVMIGMTFVIVLAISKTRLWLLFVGSFPLLIALVIFIFALLRWGAHLAFKRRSEPRPEPPTFPSA